MVNKEHHQCHWVRLKNDLEDESIIICGIDDEWVFTRNRFANAICVEDGQADYIGELLFTSHIVINFCPYCGEKLSDNQDLSYVGSNHKEYWTGTRWEVEDFYQCSPLEKYNQKVRNFQTDTDTNGLWFVTKDNYDNDDIWLLERHIFATQQMVQNGEADEVGEVCFEYGFDILFCPFCGERLDEKRSD